MQIALNGSTENQRFSTFPYEATNPLNNKKHSFKDIEDVNKLLIQCYDDCYNAGFKEIGSALYEYSRFFVDDKMIIDNKIQSTIKSYRYCKKFNCPPYKSLNETPVDIIDTYMIIDDEVTQHQSRTENG